MDSQVPEPVSIVEHADFVFSHKKRTRWVGGRGRHGKIVAGVGSVPPTPLSRLPTKAVKTSALVLLSVAHGLTVHADTGDVAGVQPCHPCCLGRAVGHLLSHSPTAWFHQVPLAACSEPG